MKSKEELDELKEEVEKLDEKLHELTEEELAQVTGGARAVPQSASFLRTACLSTVALIDGVGRASDDAEIAR